MKRFRSVLFLAAAAAIAMPVVMTMTPAAAETRRQEAFNLDPVHSMVMFRIGHMGVSYTYGRFNEPTGSFNLDFENPSSSMIDIKVETEKVDTANQGRDRHLKSPDFFNSKQFPEITFKSSSFEKTGENTMKVTGDLSLHGVTKPVDVNIVFVGEGETPQGHKAGFEAEFMIKRSDFGMTKYLENNAIGDEVYLYVTIEGKKGE